MTLALVILVLFNVVLFARALNDIEHGRGADGRTLTLMLLSLVAFIVILSYYPEMWK